MNNPPNRSRKNVVVCDPDGRAVGVADVLDAHRGTGILHKAFSIFVFRKAGAEVLVQQRSSYKELFPLRWGNACCSHPAPTDELLGEAAQKRLREELGFSIPLREAGSFVYRAKDPGGDLSEYEHDTVLVGEANHDVTIAPNPAEIADWRWMEVAELQRDLHENTHLYAPWLSAAFRIALDHLADGEGKGRKAEGNVDLG